MHNSSNTELLLLSERMLEKVKKGKPTFEIEDTMASIDKQQLREETADDAAKKTFWINIYNAWYQLLATREKLKKTRNIYH